MILLFTNRQKSRTSAATVTKDSRRRPYENILFFTDTYNKSHSDSFDVNRQNPLLSSGTLIANKENYSHEQKFKTT